ncbi:hypothetical protein [Carp edema virus]|nr:hypothetical protein [Carp edema virus]
MSLLKLEDSFEAPRFQEFIDVIKGTWVPIEFLYQDRNKFQEAFLVHKDDIDHVDEKGRIKVHSIKFIPGNKLVCPFATLFKILKKIENPKEVVTESIIRNRVDSNADFITTMYRVEFFTFKDIFV